MLHKFLIALISCCFAISDAQADPKDGFGLNLGGTTNYMASTYTVASGANTVGSTYNYNSSGLSLGMDYQLNYPNNLTLNPFIMLSGETTNLTTQTDAVMSHNILGLEGRSWRGDLFLGVHGVLYTETLSSTTTTGSTTTNTAYAASQSGTGVGIAVGWEPSNSNFTISLQGDQAKFKYSDQDVTLTGVRLSLGYRWK